MKQLLFILSVLAALLCSCTQREPAMPEAPQHDTLAAFDTLMQSQPDSALYALLDFNSTHNSLAPFDRHYADLLLSEALFKCDYEQTLRTEMQNTLLYFDSLAAAQPKSDDYTLLSARSHYMNGVGFMESDSVVDACSEYLKALEIMENCFDEKELVGQKAKFMALTYNRLGDLFSEQFLTEQALICYKNSLSFYKKCTTPRPQLSNAIYQIGLHFHMLNQSDSAKYYFFIADTLLSDTNIQLYRDIKASETLLLYETEHKADEVLSSLSQIASMAESDKEFVSRLLPMSEIFYKEGCFDSVIKYSDYVFNSDIDILSKIQAAKYLQEIHTQKGETAKASIYKDFLAPLAVESYEQKNKDSQMIGLFENYISEKQGKDFLNEKRHSKKIWLILLGVVVLMMILLIIIIKLRGKKQKVQLEKDLSETHQKHLEIQKSLSGRLKSSTENLKQEKEKTKSLQKELETIQQQKTWDSLEVFLEEDICKEILASVEGKAFKREMEKSDYQDIILNNTQLARLSTAVEKHFSGFRKMLADKYPKMDENEFNLCYLYLLNLNDIQISALLNVGYSSLKKRVSKLKKAFKTEKELLRYICDMVM